MLEAHENYQKQSWRNRCNILTANGIEALQVPVVHEGGSFRHPITQIKVDWSRDFMTRHKRAIDSAYMSSAFFEHYREALYAVLDQRAETLWDLDTSVMNFFLDACHLPHPGLTEEFAGECADIHPKREDIYYRKKPYFQVFSPKYGFTSNLSIMDLLFNEGPDSVSYL